MRSVAASRGTVRFSMVWKHFFHTMENVRNIFPYHGNKLGGLDEVRIRPESMGVAIKRIGGIAWRGGNPLG